MSILWQQIELLLDGGSMPASTEAVTVRLQPSRAANDDERSGRRTRGRSDPWSEDEIDPPIVRSIVSAAECQPLRIQAPSSVFDLARFRGRGAANDEPKSAAPATRPGNVLVVTREVGVVRCQAIRFSETEEGQEKERARRARQKPPRARKQKFRLKNSFVTRGLG